MLESLSLKVNRGRKDVSLKYSRKHIHAAYIGFFS